MKLDWRVSFLSLKIRQLAGKLRAFKEDPSLWETCHKKLSVFEEEKFVSLLNVFEIEPKGTSPILPVDKNLKDDTSEKTWGQIVLWSPPNKHGNNLPNAAVAVNFEEAGAYKTRFFTICFFICVFQIFQVDFTSLLQGPGGFLDLAVEHACSAAAAACAAAEAASRTFPAPAKKKTYSVAGSPEKPKKKKQKTQSPGGQCVEKWWKPDFQKDPLQDFWDKDVAKGLNMTPKCFASRIYHKIDKNSRTRAKKAHAAAMHFALGQSE